MRFLSSVVDLFRAWWQVDRIRISPVAGKVLRLRRGAILVIDGQNIVVCGRRVIRQGGRICVVYDCQTPSDRAWLRIDPGDGVDASPQIEWVASDIVRRLRESDIEVWRTTRS